jgi:hypothetical protein
MEVEPRGLVKSAESVGVSTPESDGNVGAGADGEVEVEAEEDLIEDLSPVDGFGPGFELRQFDGIGLGVIKELGAASGDQAIEGASAQTEAFGLLEANTVIFDGCKAGEALEVVRWVWVWRGSCVVRGGLSVGG